MTGPGSQGTILIVDDDPDVREILSLMLAEEGFDAVAVAHGEAALRRLEEGLEPRAIILDLMMPVMNGWEFWDRTRESPRFRRFPVVILTATGLTQGALGDAARILPKPVGRDALLATLATVTQRAA